jgi:hypothetical protein
MDRSTLAKRQLQIRAWAHSGAYMSRSQAIKYFKEQGLAKEIQHDISVSFRESSVSDSVVMLLVTQKLHL